MALMPPPLDLPSATALRAFEAAARLESFSRAAEELHVTPAAIAQHVKAVEAWADQPLFERTARGVSLSEAGRRTRPLLTDAFHALGAAANRLRDGGGGITSLRIAALPAIAELWVTPRLAEIRALAPEADVSIHAVDRRPDLHRDGFDMTAGFEPAADHDSDRLVLVAAPSIAATIQRIDDLATATRLRDLAWEHHWTRWLGDQPVAPARSIDVTLFSIAVEAARRGEGVLVGRRSLLARHLESGVLVEPLDRRAPTGDRLTIRLRDDIARSRLGAWVNAALSSS
ncbi:MAG: LysR family transcriptional regulator [Actinomycetota bacterium]